MMRFWVDPWNLDGAIRARADAAAKSAKFAVDDLRELRLSPEEEQAFFLMLCDEDEVEDAVRAASAIMKAAIDVKGAATLSAMRKVLDRLQHEGWIRPTGAFVRSRG